MVEDAIEEPTRIAQLLASELTGLETGSLAAVSVTDADRSAAPSPDGTRAYTVASDGAQIGAVVLFPDAAVLELTPDGPEEPARYEIGTGAGVKRAVDWLRDALADREH